MKKSSKIILWIICSFFALMIVLLAALPTWISSTSGTQIILKWMNAEVNGTLKIEKIDLSWFGKQRFRKVIFCSNDESIHFNLDALETKTSLFYLLFGGRSFGSTTIVKPHLLLQEKEREPSKSSFQLAERVISEKEKKARNWPKFKDSLKISDGYLAIAKKDHPLITLSEIEVEKKGESDCLQLHAKSKHGQTEGKISIQITLTPRLHADVEIIDFPMMILDEFQRSPFFSEAVGPTLNVNLQIERKENGIFTLKGHAKSLNITAAIDGETEGNQFVIKPNAQLQFTITPSFFKLLVDEKQRKNWDLASKTDLEVNIEEGIFPIKFKKINFKDILFKASGKLNRAELHHSELGGYTLKQFDLSIISLNNLEINYQGEILGKEATQFSGNLSVTPDHDLLYQTSYKGFPVTLLGLFSEKLERELRLLFGNQFDLKSQGTFSDHQIDGEVEIKSPLTEATTHLKGNFEKLNFESQGIRYLKGEKTHIVGHSIEFHLGGILYADNHNFYIPTLWGKLYNPYFELDVRGRLGEPNLPFAAENIHLILTGNVSHLPLNKELSQPTIENIILFLQVDGSKNQILGKAEAKGFMVDFEITNLIDQQKFVFEKSKIRFLCDLNEIPTALANSLISENLNLSALIGPTLSLQANGLYAPDQNPGLILDLQAKGSGFTTALAITLDETLEVSNAKPSFIHWQMTPQRYEALMQYFRLDSQAKSTFKLIRPTEIKVEITQLTCPTIWPKNLGAFLCQSGFVGEIDIGKTTFQSRSSKETLIFQEVKGSVRGANFTEAIDLILNGEILATPVPLTEKSAFSFEGKMLNFWTKSGHFNREQLTIKGILNLDLLPVRPILGILPLDTESRAMAHAILGELMNARIQGEISQLSGPITVDIKSSNFKALLPLQLERSAIYLREYVDAEISLTEGVNEIFLRDINPLLLTAAYSDHPIRLYIDPEGFMIPIRPYTLQGIQIGRASINIGKIRVRNGGQVKALMEFLKAKEITPDGFMEAWFTPIYFNLFQGIVSYNRFDVLLASSVHIAMWGRVNLLNNQVRMTLGIAPTTLNHRFKISGLGKKDLFQVKMRGTTDHLDLDWGSATKRLSFILSNTVGGPLGSLIGGILETLGSSFGDKPAPPPTTDPLPWEV